MTSRVGALEAVNAVFTYLFVKVQRKDWNAGGVGTGCGCCNARCVGEAPCSVADKGRTAQDVPST